ncbi:hypothetical protein TYRP_004687 [Tyrophagus putrescentiae]|nr:hypothetical protein TYRP_004687 [Tyrophagus putrescentiae]
MCAKRSLSTELVKSARVATGVGIYQQLQQLRPEVYQFAPPEGLELTVDYADTASEGQEFEKVIVAVHGCPGYYTNFDRLIEHFRHSKVRVIAPNLPDFSHTRSTQTFWHSTAEKALFLKDFLRQLGVTTIDCLVSHSFGIQTIAALWEDPGNIQINSVCLFAPQPLWLSHKQEVEMQKAKRMFYFRSELWYNFLGMTRIHKLPSMPMRFDNVNEFLLICTTVLDDQSPIDLHRRIELLVKSNIPVTLMYGSEETLVTKGSIAKLNEELGVKPEEIIRLDGEKHTADDLPAGKRITSYVIQKGGHFAHANFYQFSNRMHPFAGLTANNGGSDFHLMLSTRAGFCTVQVKVY